MTDDERIETACQTLAEAFAVVDRLGVHVTIEKNTCQDLPVYAESLQFHIPKVRSEAT